VLCNATLSFPHWNVSQTLRKGLSPSPLCHAARGHWAGGPDFLHSPCGNGVWGHNPGRGVGGRQLASSQPGKYSDLALGLELFLWKWLTSSQSFVEQEYVCVLYLQNSSEFTRQLLAFWGTMLFFGKWLESRWLYWLPLNFAPCT
jgi:hypothetical protein